MAVVFHRIDLDFILQQILIAEAEASGTPLSELVSNPEFAFGLRTVTGVNNHITGNNQVGAADNSFPRLLPPAFISAETSPPGFGPPTPTSYTQTHGAVFDSAPRTISNLIVDDTANNPAAVAAAAGTDGSELVTGTRTNGTTFQTFFIPNTTPDAGLSAPFNAWMTFFGQFFDHGLDLVTKGGNGTVYIPLQPDDPLYVPGSPTNFMVLTRATMMPGPDGILGTNDDVHEQENITSPFVDQNQTYSSHPSHQVFLRAYTIGADGAPHATGKLITGKDLGADGRFGGTGANADTEVGGMATWAVVKAQARDILGIHLTDAQVFDVPLLATDDYGNFIKGAHGFPQVVIRTGNGADGIAGTADDTTILVEGNPAANGGLGIDITNAVSTGHEFLVDIAHDADPSGGAVADADSVIGGAVVNPLTGLNTVYDNELLDKHYIAGDGRVNENIGLTAVHSIFHSEHNRLVDQTKEEILAEHDLTFLNKWLMPDAQLAALPTTQAQIDALHWNGERLFQAAKFGTEMQYQHLVFEEFARTVQPTIDAFVDFNQDVDPSIVAEFAHTVYRFGHSMLTETVDRLDPNFVSSEIGLIQAFLNPLEFAASGPTPDQATGAIVRGLTRQVGNEIDEFVTEALRNNLVGLPLDLAALNLARGRDVGIPSLNAARATFYAGTGDSNIKPYISWADFVQHIKHPESLINFIAAYGTHSTITSATTTDAKRAAAAAIVLGGVGAPDDRLDFLNSTGEWANSNLAHAKDRDGVTTTGLGSVDFWIGGLAEEQMPFGGLLGTTFGFVFETQLESLQNGDRFYYLHRVDGLPFQSQLENNLFSKLIMANTDVKHLPAHVFTTPAFTLEVNRSNQFTGLGAAGRDDPTGGIMINGVEITQLVIRDNPNTVSVDTNYLQYNGPDHVVLGGTAGNDIIVSSEGDDTLWGDEGNDRLEGGYGNDEIEGGAGDDIITDMGGSNVVHGGDGNDVVAIGNTDAGGSNLIITGDGNDFIIGREDVMEVFAGAGNDFIRGNFIDLQLMGGEGDDWIEQGTQDGAPGDLFGPIFPQPGEATHAYGNDVFLGDGGFDENLGEGGDDIVVVSEGPDRDKAGSGYDWTTFKDDKFGVVADMSRIVHEQLPNFTDSVRGIHVLYQLVEGLSGSHHSDLLTGSDDDVTRITSVVLEEGADHALRNFAAINGLRAFVGAAGNGADGIANTADDVFDTGNIILGGGGSDVIEGRGGDDLIDGDKWLNVRISVHANVDGTGPQINTFDSMDGVDATGKRLSEYMLDGTYNPGQLVIVREILTDAVVPGQLGNSFDTAQFTGLRSEYTITTTGGVTTVTDSVAGRDGVDRLTNIERLQFNDTSVVLAGNAGANSGPVGQVTILNASNNPLNTAPASGQVLHASVAGVTDANNTATSGALVTGDVSYIWQAELVPGSGIFEDIMTLAEGGAADHRATGTTYTVTDAQVGLLIRAKAIYQDQHGVVEQVTSLPTQATVAGAPVAPPAPLPTETLVSSPGVHFIRSDLQFILDQIKIAEQIAGGADPASLVPDMRAPYGLRTVTGENNNLRDGQSDFGAADSTFPRMLTPQFIGADNVPAGFGPPGTTSYAQTSGNVFDSDPRTISNLIVDDTASNPAAVAAAAATPGSELVTGTRANGTTFETFVMPNQSPDAGLSAPFNAWMTFFGQFFDHGLDLVTKGGPNGIVFIPLQPDDPLYVVGSPTNFMVMTRATMLPGADGILGTVDDIHEQENTTSPFVDQNQTYSSHPSHQVFLRGYAIGADGAPHATGKLITNRDLGVDGEYGTADDTEIGGMATWAVVKAQARDVLGINLTDAQVFNVPLLATDAYGNFIKGAHGFPQVVIKTGPTTAILVEGDPTANGGLGIDITNAVGTGHQFLIDVAHDSDPSGGKLADDDTLLNGDLDGSGAIDNGETAAVAGRYDNEMLDKHYIAGDGRVNENIGLTAVHSIFHSEHNRLVQLTKDVALASNDVSFINEWLMPNAQITALPTTPAEIAALQWNGERLFQSAKFGTEMQYQHLVFEEFARTIQPNIDFHVPENQNYHIEIDASIVAEFAHTVYRFGHSMLTETIDRLDPNYNSSEIGLIQAFLNPLEFAASGPTPDQATGAIVRGLTRQVGNEIDEFVTEALRNNLVGLPLDLAALNLARGRDVGIPSLNAARATFYRASGDSNLKPYISWADFVQHIKHPESLINFIAAYGTHSTIVNATTTADKRAAATALVLGGVGAPDDRLDFLNSTGEWANSNLAHAKDRDGVTTTGLGSIDLWIGGLAEELMPFGGMLGSTFNFVFENQLENLQNGDRFYYLSRTAGMNFNSELENNSFAALIMANTDATHLPNIVFKTPTWILEVDQSKQHTNLGLDGRDDPTNAPVIGGVDLTPLVIRDNPNTVGPDGNYLQYTGPDHVVLGGTDGNDILISSEGDDTIYGDAGNDRIDGGYGNDFVEGGDGDDIITDLGGDDTLHGNEGNDVIQGGNGINLILGGPGKDFVVSGSDSTEVFGGTGDDFIRGSLNDEQLMGGEGDDWIEEGTGDAAPGDNFDPFGRDPIIGNDIFIGNGSTDIFFAEGGDDLMFGNGGAGDRYIGDSGYDWAGFKGSTTGVSVDIGLPDDALTPPIPEVAATVARFKSVEGLSGSHKSDILLGTDDDSTAIRASGATGSVMTNMSLINGMQSLLDTAFKRVLSGAVATPDGLTTAGGHVTSFGTGNIILGGGGSDIIAGKGGDDVIDGDKWLNVRISVRANVDGTGPEIASFDSMTDLIPFMVSGAYNPGQLVAVREILTDAVDPLHLGHSFDTVTFSGLRADYTISIDTNGTANNLADDIITVTDSVAGRDGVDILMHIERLQFSDQTFLHVAAGQNREPTGAVALLHTATGLPVVAPVQGETLRVSLANLLDADNVSSAGHVVQPVAYVWQVETRPGTGVFEDIGIAVGGGLGTAHGETFTVTAAELGLAIRVKGIYQDEHGTLETVFSATTGAVVVNSPSTGTLTISDTTPTEDVAIIATALISDTDGISPGGITFQWQQANTAAGPFTDIVGATTASFTPGATQVLRSLRVIATVTDDAGAVTVFTSTPTGQVGDHVVGDAGANTLSATAFDDWIEGLGGADVLTGGAGDDRLFGGGGADVLNGGNGNDALFGEAGADTLNGGLGADTMTGGAGNDTYTVDDAGDVVVEATNAGDDLVQARIATYTLTANVEDLTFLGTGNFTGTGNDLNNTIRGVAGNDTLSGGNGNDSLFGDDGNDTLNGGAGVDQLRGENGDDTLNGGDGDDNLQGALGVDTLNGDAGNDVLNGNTGDDILTGGAGNDTLNGGVDNDTAVFAGPIENYVLSGNTTSLTITDTVGNGGTDTLTGIEVLRIGGVNYTVVAGTSGVDAALNGGAGSQALFGFGANDTLNAGTGNDLLIGGGGNDTVNGGDGDDFVFQNSTGDGQDFIDGGIGSDTYTLTGDASTETFRIYARAAWLAVAGNTAAQLNANTEIVITRNGTNASSILAQLDNIEEIKINSLLTTAQNNDGVVNGTAPGAPGDVVQVIGNFAAPFTSLAFNTIRIAGSSANDTIDISGLTSAHRVVFDANGGTDTFIGTVRPQDVITGIPGLSAGDPHVTTGTGIESDFQLMELTNRTNLAATQELVDHFSTRQLGREMIGFDIESRADLFLNSHDLLSGLTSARGLGSGVESDFQLMELANQTTVAGNDVFDHGMLQSGHDIVGLGAAHADLFMSSRDMLSGLDTTGPGSHQIATDYALLQA